MPWVKLWGSRTKETFLVSRLACWMPWHRDRDKKRDRDYCYECADRGESGTHLGGGRCSTPHCPRNSPARIAEYMAGKGEREEFKRARQKERRLRRHLRRHVELVAAYRAENHQRIARSASSSSRMPAPAPKHQMPLRVPVASTPAAMATR